MKKTLLLPHAYMALLMMLLVAIVSTGCTNSNDNPVNPKLSELTIQRSQNCSKRLTSIRFP